jgi:hypothetical protein
MLNVDLTLHALTPVQISTIEGELNRKKIVYSAVHDKLKRTSRYVLTVRGERELPALLRKKLGARS